MYYQLPLICEVCSKSIAYNLSSFWVLEMAPGEQPERYAMACIKCENLAAKFIIMSSLGIAQPISQLEGARLESQPLALGDSNP